MASITIEKIIVPYENEILCNWKQRESKVVPKFMLEFNGPGVSNGYGFGEWMAERFFRENGYLVFANNFDLVSKKSKYHRFTKMIETLVTPMRLQSFKEAIQGLDSRGYSVENPDLFILNLDTCFFVEAKKGKDKLREPQMRFFYLAKEFLGIESKLIYFSNESTNIHKEEILYNFD